MPTATQLLPAQPSPQPVPSQQPASGPRAEGSFRDELDRHRQAEPAPRADKPERAKPQAAGRAAKGGKPAKTKGKEAEAPASDDTAEDTSKTEGGEGAGAEAASTDAGNDAPADEPTRDESESDDRDVSADVVAAAGAVAVAPAGARVDGHEEPVADAGAFRGDGPDKAVITEAKGAAIPEAAGDSPVDAPAAAHAGRRRPAPPQPESASAEDAPAERPAAVHGKGVPAEQPQSVAAEVVTTSSQEAPDTAGGGAGDALQTKLPAALMNALEPKAHAAGPAPALPTGAADAAPPEVRFAGDNHENIVRSVKAELLPNGGSMRIRLDPPQLGALQVTVQIRDGQVTAAFETTSDEATRLLGHSLNQLKSVLEAQGVAVDRLHVQQAPRDADTSRGSGSGGEQGGQSQDNDHPARQEQQRREMVRRMWRRLAGAQDPLDLTA